MTESLRDRPARPNAIAPMPALEIDRVGKSFDVAGRRVEALRDISFSVRTGEFVAIVGASGCGKSTLLRLILGLDTDYQGEVRLDGRRVEQPGLDRGVVFQDHRLLPWLTAEGNVAAALRRSGLAAGDRRRLVAEHLALVGLENFARAWPAQLSGGMSQRVAIARALVNRPRFLLLDEPLGALDALTRIEMQNLLERVWRQQRFTAVLVTHDVTEAIMLGDRVVLIEDGVIKLEIDVPIERPRRRGSPQVAALEQRILRYLFTDGWASGAAGLSRVK